VIDILGPEEIKRKLMQGSLDKESAIELLISIIENSDDDELRNKSIMLIVQNSFKNKKMFNFFENLLISDSSENIRSLAGKFIIDNYWNIGLTAIEWIIQHEPSPRVLAKILETLQYVDQKKLHSVLIKTFNDIEEKYKNKNGQKWDFISRFVDEFDMINFNKSSCRKLIDICLNFKTIYYLQAHHNSHHNLNHIKVLNGYVTKLELSGSKIKKISDINGIEFLKNLESLSLWDCKIEEIDCLRKFPNLKRLSFGSYQYSIGNEIEEIKGLELLSHLEELNLSYNLVSEIKNLDNLHNLRKLYLSHNLIKEIKGLDNLQNLETLYLDGNKISDVKGLKKLINLGELEISGNPIIDIDELNTLKQKHPNLKYIGHEFL
jgi:hypothetical protein